MSPAATQHTARTRQHQQSTL